MVRADRRTAGANLMSETLINKYRPQDFGEMVGHADQIRGLQRVLNEPSRPHGYLLTGPSGVGKTTLSRIIARYLNAEITDIDAASNNGIDAMRELIEFSHYRSYTESGNRMVILDECH